MANLAQPKRLDIYAVKRPRKSRSRKGCFQCRARRTKCDEVHPTCRSCSRLHVECCWNVLSESKKQEREVSVTAKPRNSTELGNDRCVGRSDHQGSSPPVLLQTMLTRSFPNDVKPGSTDFQPLSRSPEQIWITDLEILSPLDPFPAFESGDDLLYGIGNRDRVLFDHFCQKTVPWLVHSDSHAHLIENHVIPMARKDQLLFYTVLALGGIHLQNGMSSIEAEAVKHYISALNGLNQILSSKAEVQATDCVALLTTIVFLCHYEFVDGGTGGAALQHLRACRELVISALGHVQDPTRQELIVLLVETYGYFALTANICGLGQREHIRLGIEFRQSMMPMIKNLPSFGAMFTYEPDEIFVLPLIACFYSYKDHGVSESVEGHCVSLYRALQNDLGSRIRLVDAAANRSTGRAEFSKVQLIKDIKRDVLLLLLQASLFEGDASRQDMMEVLTPLIVRTTKLLMGVSMESTSYGLFWCFLVLGSFLRDAESQSMLVQQMEKIGAQTPSQSKGIKLLRQLWQQGDCSIYGVLGLVEMASTLGMSAFLC